MGYHHINTTLLDAETDPLQPKALVYAPGPNGQLQFALVEYVVVAEARVATGNVPRRKAQPDLFRWLLFRLSIHTRRCSDAD
jgi:hypothetical protein